MNLNQLGTEVLRALFMAFAMFLGNLVAANCGIHSVGSGPGSGLQARDEPAFAGRLSAFIGGGMPAWRSIIVMLLCGRCPGAFPVPQGCGFHRRDVLRARVH